MTVRTATPDDAPAVVALRAAVFPYLVRGEAATRRMIGGPGRESHAACVAERRGAIVGWVSAYRSGSDPDVPPAGVRLVPLAGFGAEEFHAAYVAAASDEPGDVPADTLDFDRWRDDVWDDPGLDRAVSCVAVVRGVVGSFTLVTVDSGRMWSDMTATVPACRGRGLALLVKRAALHRAAERGVTMAYTANDESNLAMLAVNTRLGYRPVDAQWSCLAELTSGGVSLQGVTQ